MLRRLRWLKLAIVMFHVTDAIDCDVPSEHLWLILHQIKITLLTLAKFQRILEVEDCVMGSLMVLAIYRIREACVKVQQPAHTDIAAKNLTVILLEDFDSRFRPAAEDGKVTYTGKTDVGFCNSYIALHLFCCRILAYPSQRSFSWQQRKTQYIMLPNQYEDLKRHVIDHMVALVYKNKASEEHDNNYEGTNKNLCTIYDTRSNISKAVVNCTTGKYQSRWHYK